MALLWIVLGFLLFCTLAYKRVNIYLSVFVFAVYFGIITAFSTSIVAIVFLWLFFVIIASLLIVKPLRRLITSRYIFNIFRHSLPTLSSTEKEALAAGTVGWDGELFSGKPNWDTMLRFPKPELTEEELNFINGPVAELCEMIDNWDITHNRSNLPDKVWDFLKTKGFFAIIIPKTYGGMGFSAYAHSTILTRIAGRSSSVGSIVAVPNSLGPAELLLHYGTEEQQAYYLPRLAKGLEIPCFALTGPEAGSDASAMPDYGVVCKGTFEGKEIIGIKLNWDKRYITLAPVATVLGLAFKLYDPEGLIGSKRALGITCALIPTNTPGITIGRRHFPLGAAFPNGPTQGKDVFVPLDWIIGGIKMAGQGWRMLVECLAAGRGISLPSMTTGGSQVSAYATGAYARIREQFHQPIGKFGGIEEALARIAGRAYIMEATRVFTVAAIDRGEKPAVPAAISKYHVTELSRKVINDAMDVHGGKGICMGPKNYLAFAYRETPISITVEGANILTRSMIIFGQGAIRCHPYILKEMQAALSEDPKQGLKDFDTAFFAHSGFLISNAVRAFVLGITNSKFASVPNKKTKRYFQYFTRFSAGLAFVSDLAMISLGGSLKRKEKLSGRLGDVLSMLYLGSAVLKQFDEAGEPDLELPVVDWACQSILYNAQEQLYEALVNFPIPFLGQIMKFWVFPLGKRHTHPTDKLVHKLARLMLNPDSLRSSLARDLDLTPGLKNPVGSIETVLQQVIATEDLTKKLQQAVSEKKIDGYTFTDRVKEAVAQNILTEEEADKVLAAYKAKKEVLAVDDFAPEELENRFVKSEEKNREGL